MHLLWSEPAVAAALGGVRDRRTVEQLIHEAGEHWEAHGFGRWVLWAGDERIGTVKLAYCSWTGEPEVELGYAIAPRVWNQGYAAEAARGALDYARDHTGLSEVIAVVADGNSRSMSVLQRLGFGLPSEVDLAEGRHSVYRRRV